MGKRSNDLLGSSPLICLGTPWVGSQAFWVPREAIRAKKDHTLRWTRNDTRRAASGLKIALRSSVPLRTSLPFDYRSSARGASQTRTTRSGS